MALLRRNGRPGLLGMVARTAVVAGTATAVSGAVTQRQHSRAAEQQALQQQELQQQLDTQQQVQRFATPPTFTAPSSAPTAPVVDVVVQLQQLGALHQQGLLSAEEFALAKQQLLGG